MNDQKAKILADQESRRQKADKILAVLADANIKLTDAVCIDIGCAYGLITQQVALRSHLMIGIERDGSMLQQALPDSNCVFIQGDALHLPISDNSADVVICAQVYEHVDDDAMLFSEIWRILKINGVCFFSGPNRIFPYEYHWRLPLVHWLPWSTAQKVANAILHSSAEKVHLRSYWSLKNALKLFIIKDYTSNMLNNPEIYHLKAGHSSNLYRHLPHFILQCVAIFAPNLNWLLIKTNKLSNHE